MYTITAVKQTQTTTWSKQVKSTLDPLSDLHTHIWNLTPPQQYALLTAVPIFTNQAGMHHKYCITRHTGAKYKR